MSLRDYQHEAVEFGIRAERWVLGDPPGAGKTAVASVWLRTAPSERALVVAPLQVQQHWAAELSRWAHAVVWDGTGTKEKRATARNMLAHQGGVYLTNYEALRTDVAELIRLGFDTFIADEAHRLKSRTAQQTRAAGKVARRAGRVCFVTGTPVLNRADELFSYLQMIDPKTYTSFWRWAREHFEIETPMYGYSVKPVMKVGKMLPGHEDRIRDELRGLLIQRPIEQLLPNMPPVVESVLPVTLSAAERKAYDQLMKKSWVQLGDEVVIASNTVSRQTRARQLASDWGSVAPALSEGSKVLATTQLVRDLAAAGQQVVVLTAFREAAQRIAAAFPGEASLYLGGMTTANRVSEIEVFRSQRNRVFVGTLAAVGEGTDGLQVANHIVLHDRDWTPARNEQAIARIRRSGQAADAVHVYHVVAQDTVDQVVADALTAKQGVIDALDLAGLL